MLMSWGNGWWACQDLNLGTHPYQQSGAYRCATLHFRRWCATVEGQVMRSYVPADERMDRTPRPRDKLEDQSVAGKAMGLPGGRGSPITRRDRDRDQVDWPTRVLRPGRMAACTASPPARARAAASNPSDATRQPDCPSHSTG